MPRIRAFPLHALLQTPEDSPDFQEMCAGLYDTLTMHVQDRELCTQNSVAFRVFDLYHRHSAPSYFQTE